MIRNTVNLASLVLFMFTNITCKNSTVIPGDGIKSALPGFHHNIYNVIYLNDNPDIDIKSDKGADKDIDLIGMAKWAFEALKKNPRPNLNYECIFSMSLLKYPPCPGPEEHDPITTGDTENRLDWEFGYLKDMLGDNSGDKIAEGLRKRIMSYLQHDGLCWVTNEAFSQLPGVYANQWTTAKLLISLSNDYKRTYDTSLQPVCRKMFEGLRDRADWVNGKAYYAGGNSCWNKTGWAITDSTPYHPAMLLEGIATYCEAFGDKEALEFAIAFAKGEMANEQWNHWIMRDPSKLTEEQKEQLKYTNSNFSIWPTAPQSINLGVRPDGSFDHHSHMRGHNGWGMAHVAYLTKNPELIAWSKRLLDFFLINGTDYGWIPESQTFPRRSETCAVADVIDIAKYVAQCGYPEYWDVVERFVRNYIREAQFFITPEYEKLYRHLHPGSVGEKGLVMVKNLQGGFLGAMGVYDRCYAKDELDMMGCCVPEGMRALHSAWSNTIMSGEDGVRINMSFARDSKEAQVLSYLPDEGRMRVRSKVSNKYWLRPPSWAPKEQVRIYLNGKEETFEWIDSYVYLEDVNKGDVIDLTYPLISFIQKQVVKNAEGEPVRNITVSWVGNTVVKLEPKGEQLPVYQQVPKPLPPIPFD
jgi:hypothetical protein